MTSCRAQFAGLPLQWFCPSRKISEQIPRLDGEGLRQFDDVLQSDIPLAAFNPADVVPVQTGPFGQFFLRISALVAELP